MRFRQRSIRYRFLRKRKDDFYRKRSVKKELFQLQCCHDIVFLWLSND